MRAMLRAAQLEVERRARLASSKVARLDASDVARLAAQAAVPLAVAVVIARILGPRALGLWRDREYLAHDKEAAKRHAERVRRMKALAPKRAKEALAARAARIRENGEYRGKVHPR